MTILYIVVDETTGRIIDQGMVNKTSRTDSVLRNRLSKACWLHYGKGSVNSVVLITNAAGQEYYDRLDDVNSALVS